VDPMLLRGAVLAVGWTYVGFEAAVRSDVKPWAGRMAPLLGCLGVSELLHVISVHHDGGWQLAAAAMVAGVAGVTTHRALLDLDDTATAGQLQVRALGDALDTPLTLVHDARDALEHLVIRADRDQTVDFDIDQVLTDVVVAHRAAGLGVTLGRSGLRAHGRPDDLATALRNLLTNARQHGGGVVDVRAVGVAGRVEIHVADRGPGLSASQVATLFQRGARGPATTGSGLGLHVSRALMHQQNGDLQLRRATGGAVFALVLPASRAAARLPGLADHLQLRARLVRSAAQS
jgi:signal transduction histidine kinase